ncbi:MAG: PAS domain S-box protein [Planctomycetaceae bacterium]|nr:PAS domain S-box protein [Planctomycetaceae bacterium]
MAKNHETSGRYKKKLVRILFYTLPFIVVFFAIFAIVNAQKRIWKNNLHKELQIHIYRETIGVESYLREVVQDISFLADSAEETEIFDNSGRKVRSDLTDLFVNFGYARGIYSQFRVLDIGGMEIVRVDFKNDKAVICPEDKLQDKSSRYYFTDSIVLDKGLIYISKLDLNVENEQIEMPYNPMLRFATPIFDKSGTKKGLLVLNYMASSLLNVVGDHSQKSFDSNIKSQFLNKDGYWLYNSEQEKCWGFMFNDRQNRSMIVENPELWEKIKNSTDGIFENKEGIFVYNTVYPLKTAFGRLGIENISDIKTRTGERYWKIVSYIPSDYIAAYQSKANMILFLLFGVISVVIIIIENKLISNQKQLLQKQENLETVFQVVPVGMLLLNEKMEVVKINGFIKNLISQYSLGDQLGNLLGCIHSFETPEGCGHSTSCPKCPIRNAAKAAMEKDKSACCVEVVSTLLIDGKKTDLWLEINIEPIVLNGSKHVIMAMNNITERKQAGEALKQSETMLRTIFAAAPVGIALSKGRVIQNLNNQMSEISGYTSEELIGHSTQVLYPDMAEFERVSRDLYTNLRQNGFNSIEAMLRRKDGKIVNVLLRSSMLDINDLNAGEIVTVLDITERKRVETALRQSEAVLSSTFAAAPVGILLIKERIFRKINNQMSEISGYTSEELIGQSSQILYPDMAEFERVGRELYINLGQNSLDCIEAIWQRKGGKVVNVLLSSSMLDINDPNAGEIVVVLDITERKQAEKLLQTEKDNLKAIFNAAPVGMLLLNEKAEVTQINGVVEKLIGQYHLGDQPGDLLGCIHSFETPEGCGHSRSCPKCSIRNSIVKALNLDRPSHCEEVPTTLLVEGEKITLWLEIIIEPVVLDGSKYVIVAMSDITNRKKAEKEMEEAVEMKSKFISTASHELRTPLTSIKEGVNLVYSEMTGPLNDDQKEFLGIAKRNVDRLARLINDVLDYQKMTAGRMDFNLKPANINETVKLVEETMRPLIKEKGLDLIIELDDGVPMVNFDKDKIIQVLTNLVNNALKFTEKGSVKVTTSRSDDNIITAVKDTGDGIKQEDMSKLFKEFEQLPTKDNFRKTGGTGLGLVISKKIIESHGGKIWAESEYEKGTTFYFTLPMEAIPCQIKS